MKLKNEEIIKILESVFRQKKGTINLDTPLEHFAKDSMDIIEFIAILKNKHNVTIEPSEIVILTKTSEIIEYILVNQKKA